MHLLWFVDSTIVLAHWLQRVEIFLLNADFIILKLMLQNFGDQIPRGWISIFHPSTHQRKLMMFRKFSSKLALYFLLLFPWLHSQPSRSEPMMLYQLIRSRVVKQPVGGISAGWSQQLPKRQQPLMSKWQRLMEIQVAGRMWLHQLIGRRIGQCLFVAPLQYDDMRPCRGILAESRKRQKKSRKWWAPHISPENAPALLLPSLLVSSLLAFS